MRRAPPGTVRPCRLSVVVTLRDPTAASGVRQQRTGSRSKCKMPAPRSNGTLRSEKKSTWIRQLGAPERAVIGRAGKARTAAMACAMARMRNAAGAVEGGSIGCAAFSPSG